MRSFTSALPTAGMVITPGELDAELADVGTSFHQLDRDNFAAGAVAATKVAVDAWGAVLRLERSVLQTKTHSDAGTSQDWFHLPDDLGADTIARQQTGDCVLHICFSACFQETTLALFLNVWIGVRLDGELVAKSPLNRRVTIGSCQCEAVVPVGAGVHVLEPVYGLHRQSGPLTIDWLEANLWSREMAR